MDVPSLCALCLGPDQKLKMVRQPNGEECKLCLRPFVVYRWHVSLLAKQCIVCPACARARNCCQGCTVDLHYGIPIEIRDAALKMAGVPNEYAVASSRSREVLQTIGDKLEKSKRGLALRAREILQALAAKYPSVSLPRLPFAAGLQVPADASVKSFFVFGGVVCASALLLLWGGEAPKVSVYPRAKCAFVTFALRRAAERFCDEVKKKATSGNLVVLNGTPVRLSWSAVRLLLGADPDAVARMAARAMRQDDREF